MLCRRFARRDRTLRDEAGDDQVAYYAELSALVTDTVERIRRLDRPATDRPKVTRYLKGVRRNGSLILRLADALGQGRQGAIRAIARRIRANGLRANRIAQAYGFKVCGSA